MRALRDRLFFLTFASRLIACQASLKDAMHHLNHLLLGGLAGDGAIIAEIYKERVMKRGYGSGMWGWKTAYSDSPTG